MTEKPTERGLRDITRLPSVGEMDAMKEELRRLPMDDYVEFALDHGFYDVDDTTGRVINLRTGRVLKARRNKLRHLVVHMCVFGVQRTAVVHRMIAVRRFGADQLRGKEVSNFLDDEEERPLLIGHSRPHTYKKTWDPCVRCGDLNGAPHGTSKQPSRFSGEPFGYEGGLCTACYQTEARRAREARKRKAKQRAGEAAPAETATST